MANFATTELATFSTNIVDDQETAEKIFKRAVASGIEFDFRQSFQSFGRRKLTLRTFTCFNGDQHHFFYDGVSKRKS